MTPETRTDSANAARARPVRSEHGPHRDDCGCCGARPLHGRQLLARGIACRTDAPVACGRTGRRGDRRGRVHRSLDGDRPDDTDPSLRVVVLEQEAVGFGASGRNGGFCSATLTHGRSNGRPLPRRARGSRTRGLPNLAALSRSRRRRHRVRPGGDRRRSVATSRGRSRSLGPGPHEAAAHGEELVFLDRDAVQAEVHSPRWLAGLYQPPGRDVILDPAKLVRGLPVSARARGRDPRGHAGARGRAPGGRRSRDDRDRRDRRRGARGRRDVGLLRLAAPTRDPVRAGLRLRPRVRPADARPASLDRLGAPPGDVRRQQPVPLLPAHRRRPDPVGWLRRDLPPGTTRSARGSTAGP